MPKRIRRTTSLVWVKEGVLAPWMLAYLQWLAVQPGSELAVKGARLGHRGGSVAMPVKIAQASKMAGRVLNKNIVYALEQRADVIEYFGKLRADVQFRAKELLGQDIADNVEARREGLAAAREERDHKSIKGYTDWVTEVAFPKKAPEEGVKTSVVIHLGSKQAQHLIGKALAGEVEEVECEIIETKQLQPGEDDE